MSELELLNKRDLTHRLSLLKAELNNIKNAKKICKKEINKMTNQLKKLK